MPKIFGPFTLKLNWKNKNVSRLFDGYEKKSWIDIREIFTIINMFVEEQSIWCIEAKIDK